MTQNQFSKKKYRVLSWGCNINSYCSFCHLACETKDHLFFECVFTRRVWRLGLRWCQVDTDLLEFNHILSFLSTSATGSLKKNLKALIIRCWFTASVYFTWIERNRRVFRNQPQTEESLFLEIARHVKAKISNCKNKFASTSINRKICKAWEIEHLID